MILKRLDVVFSGVKFKSALKLNKVKRIALFGSYATGRFSRGSDLDFLVEFEENADLFDQVGLKQDLEKLLKKKVDVATPRSLSRYIRAQVLREAVYL
ncbi:MAG: nucleotidyltransferase family protein [Candidatus Omnitrophica bacterium]|jgi:predicted nucleotidyltransferase|nr:nucleotidyltransferase family protein [Candidatus Omnitrophota bacterium]